MAVIDLKPRIARLILVGLSLFVICGCATISHVFNPPPKVTDLLYTEKDVMDVIDELSRGEIKDEDAVYFDGERYSLKSDVYKKAVKDGVIKRVQEKKIREFVSEYDRETIGDAVKKDLGTTGLIVLIMVVLGALLL